MRAPHQLLLVLAVAQLAAMRWAWPAYARRRVAVQAALRAARTCVHVWWTVLDSNTIGWWRGRSMSERADPQRMLAVALAAVPLALMQKVWGHARRALRARVVGGALGAQRFRVRVCAPAVAQGVRKFR